MKLGLPSLVIPFLPLLALLPAAPAGAQAPPEDEHGEPQPKRRTAAAIGALEFGGGSLAEFLSVLREAHGGPLNIVSDVEAESVGLPAFELRNVSVFSALKVAQGAARGGARIAVQRIREEASDQDVFVIRVEIRSRDEDPPRPTGAGASRLPWATGDAAADAAADPAAGPESSPQQAGGGPRAEQRLHVVSLKTLLPAEGDDRSLDTALSTALTAIEEALVLGGAGSQGGGMPNLKVHEASGLLLVRGTTEQVRIVDEVILKMAPRRAAAANESRALEDMVAQLRAEVASLREQLEALTRDHDKLFEAFHSGRGAPPGPSPGGEGRKR